MADNLNLVSLNELGDLKGFMVSHINIRSCLPKIELVRAEISNIDLDVICISESWLKSSIPDTLVAINGFVLERHDRNYRHSSKQGGGVCIYIKASINYLPHKQHWISNADIEMMCLILLPANARKMVIINIYRPPKGNLLSAIDHIKNLVGEIDNSGKLDIVILGDLNVDLLQKNPNSKAIADMLDDMGLKQIIKLPTRCSPNKETLIDHCYIRMDHIASCGTINLELSDHKMIFVVKKKATIKHKSSHYWCRDLNNFVPSDFNKTLSLHNWGRFYALSNPNDAWNYL